MKLGEILIMCLAIGWVLLYGWLFASALEACGGDVTRVARTLTGWHCVQ